MIKTLFKGAPAHRRVNTSDLSLVLIEAEIAIRLRNIVGVARCDRETAIHVTTYLGPGVVYPGLL